MKWVNVYCTVRFINFFQLSEKQIQIFTDAPKKKYEELDVQKHIPEVFYKTGGL